MAKAITIHGFYGMSNVKQTGLLFDEYRRTMPYVVFNADVWPDGRVTARQGYRKVLSLTNCHSMWHDGQIWLCVADNADGYQALFQIVGQGERTREITTVEGPPNVPMYYARVENTVYLSNGYWRKCLSWPEMTVSDWGVSLPAQPKVSIVDGNLPAGFYRVCYTRHDGQRHGGAGPLSVLGWDGDNGGLQLHNLPEDVAVWVTLTNGEQLFLAEPDDDGVIADLDQITMTPLATLGIGEVPYLLNLAYAHGRIWGTEGPRLWFSEPFAPQWFRHYEIFEEDLVMVAPILSGVFVSSRHHTWLIDGLVPAEWKIQRVGDGAIPGTLVYGQFEGGGYELSRAMSQLPMPCWLGRQGVVVGTNAGHLVHVTENRVRMNERERGAAMARQINGVSQVVITSMGQIVAEHAGDMMQNIRLNKLS